MVNMIKILVTRLRETNEKLRGLVEEQTTVPVNDVSILTVDSEDSSSTIRQTSRPKQFQSEEIIEDLFKKENS